MSSEKTSDTCAPKEIWWTAKTDDLSTLGNATFTEGDWDGLHILMPSPDDKNIEATNREDLSRSSPIVHQVFVPKNSFHDEFEEEANLGPFSTPSSQRTLWVYFVAILCGPVLAGLLIVLSFGLIRVRQTNQLIVSNQSSDVVTLPPTLTPSTQQPSPNPTGQSEIPVMINAPMGSTMPPGIGAPTNATSRPAFDETFEDHRDLNVTLPPTANTENSSDQVEISTPEPTNKTTDSPTFRPSLHTSHPTGYNENSAGSTQRPTHKPTNGPTSNQPQSKPIESTSSPVDDLPPQPNYPNFRFQTWSQIVPHIKEIATVLGYDEHSWNLPGTNSIENLTYHMVIESDLKSFETALDQLEFSPSTWDCWINHYIGCDWTELMQRNVALYFEILGWTEDAWESTDPEFWPESERSFWHALNGEERTAAEQLCYTQELWDEINIRRWDSIQAAREDFMILLENASPKSLQATFYDMGSPQNRAFLWLTSRRPYLRWSTEKRIQRWALTTFTFGLQQFHDDSSHGAIPSSYGSSGTNRPRGCNWHPADSTGAVVICSEEGLVQQINLPEENLLGTLPFELSLLSNSLKVLSIPGNRIFGEVPTEFGNLVLLDKLQLSRNVLDGEIPTELGNISNLILLEFNQNNLVGSVPNELSQLDNLEILDLSFNFLHGHISPRLGDLSALRELRLNDNQLTGTLPVALSNLRFLEALTVEQNGLTGRIPDGVCDLALLDILLADCDSLLDCTCWAHG